MSGTGLGTRTSSSWTKALRKGLGCRTEWNGEELLSLHRVGCSFTSRWRCPPPSLFPTRPPSQGRGTIWLSLAPLQAADPVRLLTLASPAPCFARMLVERFSVSLRVIPPVHPGETVFLPRRQPLHYILDHSPLKPRSALEGLFLR